VVRAASIALLLLAVLAVCGPEQSRLTVVVRPQGLDGPARARTISCADDDRQCQRVRAAQPAAFAPVPDSAVCTQTYGGPATARVTGTLDGEHVDARFSLRDGCQISRWERLAWLLGEPPGISVSEPVR
jgi:hypothetical protein